MSLALFIRAGVQMAAIILPWPLRRSVLNMLPGFSIARESRIGFALILSDRTVLEPGARIGHFTVIHPIGLLQLGRYASIGRGNRVIGAQEAHIYSREPGRQSALLMGEHSGITRNHLIDCSNTVRVGKFTLIAGWRTQILTHSPDFANSRQVTAAVTIGDYCFIGTACIILKGSSFPDRSILAAGSVYSKSHDQGLAIYAGNPAVPVRQLSADLAYFRRPVGKMRHPWHSNGEEFGG
jgi:acetyltransferase-like isoleucine patch superfamily enzyme